MMSILGMAFVVATVIFIIMMDKEMKKEELKWRES